MRKKVLYIEDEPYLARIVKDTLEMKGYEVMHRKEGANITEHISNFSPDICLLDIMLPDIDGFALANHIRNINPNLPVIFLTAKTQTDDLGKRLRCGWD